MWQEYLFSSSVEEALAMLAEREGRARLVAGGTDLVIQLTEGQRSADCLVDITRIPELGKMTLEDGMIVLGANVTHRQVSESALVRERATVLAQACRAVGSLQIRNVGTLGGNVVNAMPAADGTTALLALEAEAEIADGTGRKWVPLPDLFAGPGLSRVDGTREMLTAFRFQALGEGQGSALERIARRRALALPILICAVVVTLSEGGEHFESARIALAPVAPVPFRASQAEESLRGAPISLEAMARAGEIAMQESHPRSSLLRASQEYREEVIKVLVRRGLERAV
ncbi:MAG: FAD binding domain-containing protein [Anaerolineae bacterium]